LIRSKSDKLIASWAWRGVSFLPIFVRQDKRTFFRSAAPSNVAPLSGARQDNARGRGRHGKHFLREGVGRRRSPSPRHRSAASMAPISSERAILSPMPASRSSECYIFPAALRHFGRIAPQHFLSSKRSAFR